MNQFSRLCKPMLFLFAAGCSSEGGTNTPIPPDTTQAVNTPVPTPIPASEPTTTRSSDAVVTQGPDSRPQPDAGPTLAPFENVDAPTVLLNIGEFSDGPVWSAQEGALFFTTPLGNGALYRMRPDGVTMKVRDGVAAQGSAPIGTTVDSMGNLLMVQARQIASMNPSLDAGADAPIVIANGYADLTGAARAFDTLNDAVISANGTIYATDPGYFTAPTTNRIYRITKTGAVSVVEEFNDIPRPNGIALSPDGKSLYVGFSVPAEGTKPFIRMYAVNDDGTLGQHAVFTEFDIGSEPDGIEVDQAGNVYVASKLGITAFSSNGKNIGRLTLADTPTGMAFGGSDLKTMYITTQGTNVYSVKVNVAGIVQ